MDRYRWKNYVAYFDHTFLYEMSSKTHLPEALKTLTKSFQDASPSLEFLGSCSYPCGTAYHNPNMSLVQTAVKSAGVDLRYIFMTRLMEEVVYNFSVERLQSLIVAGQTLLRDLRFLPPSKIYCVPYHDTVLVADKISRFLGRDISHAIRTTFEPRNKRYHNHLKKTPEWKTLQRIGH